MSPTDEQLRLLHAMQSGIAYLQANRGLDHDNNPKHLRVGINNALCLNGALVRLLLAKGIFTEDEWNQSYEQGLREEVARYEIELSSLYGGAKVTLG